MQKKSVTLDRKRKSSSEKLSTIYESKGWFYCLYGLAAILLLILLIKNSSQSGAEFSFSPEKDPHFRVLKTTVLYNSGKLLTFKDSELDTKIPNEDINKYLATQEDPDLLSAKFASVVPLNISIIENQSYPNLRLIKFLSESEYSVKVQEFNELKPIIDGSQEYVIIPANSQSTYPITNQSVTFALARNNRLQFNPNFTFWITPSPDAAHEEYIEFSSEEAAAEVSQDERQTVFKLTSTRVLAPGQQVWVKAIWTK